MSAAVTRLRLWLQLTLACLTLVAGAVPAAHARPAAEPTAAAWVQRQALLSQRQARTRRAVPSAIREALPAATPRPAAVLPLAVERPPRPSPRLFLTHRALLR